MQPPSPVAEPVTIATLPDFAMCPSPILVRPFIG